jgi:hypothetical protein
VLIVFQTALRKMTTATEQTALSVIFKDRMRDMPNNLDDKEILAYAKNIIKLVRDIKKIGKGKKNPKNKE